MEKIRLGIVGVSIFLQLFSAHAQNSEHPWAFGFGFNILQVNTITDSYRATKELFIENNGNDAIFKTPFYLYGERYIGNKISLKLMVSINNIYRKRLEDRRHPESILQFHAADIKVKIRLLDPDRSHIPFDPFIAFGGAYAAFKNTAINKTTNGGKIAAGLGFVYWIDEHIGVNVQSDYNYNPLRNDFDYFQHSFGISIRFGKAMQPPKSDILP